MPAPAFLRSPRTLAAVFGLSGVIHLIAPRVYESIVPKWLPRHREVVYASGLVELACAAGLLTEAGWAGPLSAATLVGVWPANIQMAVDITRADRPLAVKVATWARVPMQIPMILMALRSRRRTPTA